MANQVRVFVSHHHSPDEDDFTARLVRDLDVAGADVWVDNRGIPAGNFVAKISEGLEGRQWLIFVMTPDALRSPWVRSEVETGIGEYTAGRMRGVLPLVMKPCAERDIPMLWRKFHRFDATKDYVAARAGLLLAMGLPVPVEPVEPVEPIAQPEPVAPRPAPWLLQGEQPANSRERRLGLTRPWLAVLAAAVLLVVALGGAGLLRAHQQQVNAQQTQTANANATANANMTATAGIAVTATDVAATATAAVGFPTATATYGPTSDVTSPPPAPSEANKIVFADASPTCHGAAPAWITDNVTQVKSCPATGGVEIVAQSSTTLGCIEQQAHIPNDAYISVLVTPIDGGLPSILFREGVTPDNKGTGYLFLVNQTNLRYSVLSLDADSTSPIIGSGSLQGQPAADFALGVLVQGHFIFLYINGQRLNNTPIADATYNAGWISLCTTGDTIFRDVQVYNLKSSVG